MSALEERVSQVEEKVAAMQKLFGRWLEQQVAVAKQSLNQQVTAGPIDEQVALINARVGERQAKGGGPVKSAPVKFGEPAPAFDAQEARILGKRQEMLGAKK